jgi:hypothetical protein
MLQTLGQIIAWPFRMLFRLLLGLLRLIPYLAGLLLIVLVVLFFMRGGFDWLPSGIPGLDGLRSPTPTVASSSGEAASDQLIFRVEWQGEQILYLGNQISEEEFAEVARQAKEVGGRLEIQRASNVTVDNSSRREALLTELDVSYRITPVE